MLPSIPRLPIRPRAEMAARLDIVEAAKTLLGDKVKASHELLGNATLVVDAADARGALLALRDDPTLSFDFLADLTGVDYAEMPRDLVGPYQRPANRFDCVYHLYSMKTGRRLRLRARLDEENPSVSSVSDLWKCADPMEREAWDMFGFKFPGHPNLKRMFMHESFVGHPLRKDYPIDKRQGIWAPVDLLGFTP